MHVWITQYALTRGIFEVEAKLSAVTPSMAIVEPKDEESGHRQYFHGEGKEWHRTENEAKAKAEEMRIAKIASLKKQLDKLEKMKF